MDWEHVWEAFEVIWMIAVTGYVFSIAHTVRQGNKHGHSDTI